jgi:hypothetical protein
MSVLEFHFVKRPASGEKPEDIEKAYKKEAKEQAAALTSYQDEIYKIPKDSTDDFARIADLVHGVVVDGKDFPSFEGMGFSVDKISDWKDRVTDLKDMVDEPSMMGAQYLVDSFRVKATAKVKEVLEQYRSMPDAQKAQIVEDSNRVKAAAERDLREAKDSDPVKHFEAVSKKGRDPSAWTENDQEVFDDLVAIIIQGYITEIVVVTREDDSTENVEVERAVYREGFNDNLTEETFSALNRDVKDELYENKDKVACLMRIGIGFQEIISMPKEERARLYGIITNEIKDEFNENKDEVACLMIAGYSLQDIISWSKEIRIKLYNVITRGKAESINEYSEAFKSLTSKIPLTIILQKNNSIFGQLLDFEKRTMDETGEEHGIISKLIVKIGSENFMKIDDEIIELFLEFYENIFDVLESFDILQILQLDYDQLEPIMNSCKSEKGENLLVLLLDLYSFEEIKGFDEKKLSELFFVFEILKDEITAIKEKLGKETLLQIGLVDYNKLRVIYSYLEKVNISMIIEELGIDLFNRVSPQLLQIIFTLSRDNLDRIRKMKEYLQSTSGDYWSLSGIRKSANKISRDEDPSAEATALKSPRKKARGEIAYPKTFGSPRAERLILVPPDPAAFDDSDDDASPAAAVAADSMPVDDE